MDTLVVLEPDHKKLLAELNVWLDVKKAKGGTTMYSLVEKILQIVLDSIKRHDNNPDIVVRTIKESLGELYKKYSESFSECPKIPEAKEMIDRTKAYMDSEHPSDTNLAEVASIGHDYTFHTHPRGTAAPSDPDIDTTRALRKKLLCIGLVPQKKIVCYNSESLVKECEHPA